MFGPSALFDLCNQFNHSSTDLEILPYFKLQPYGEKKELETRIERAAYCAGWGAGGGGGGGGGGGRNLGYCVLCLEGWGFSYTIGVPQVYCCLGPLFIIEP